MNFSNESIGNVQRLQNKFVETLGTEVRETFTLPRIMCGIAPEPTQFPSAIDVLQYYNMEKLDIWEYLARSNGLKLSRNIWFMAEPPGEVWIPLVRGMQRYNTYDALCKVGDEVRILMSGKAYMNQHTVDILPSLVTQYLKRDNDTRFSTAKGYVKDLSKYESIRGLIGRIVINFP